MKIPYFPKSEAAFKEDIFKQLMNIHQEVHTNSQLGLFLKSVYEKYYPWERFSNLPLPNNTNNHEILWYYIKTFMRSPNKQIRNLKDVNGKPFGFSLTDTILKNLHSIDMRLSDNIVFQHQGIEENQQQEWLKKRVIASLIEEAITSSQIEGAATTRKQAKALIKSGQKPRTHDEKMILNNYHAIRLITEKLKEDALSPELIKKIHAVIADGVLDDPNDVGCFRHDEKDEEKIKVFDEDGEILFVPPPYTEVEQRVVELCKFANDDQEFYHPVIKAIILHFMIGYIHPFADGNGRTARGLFYWYLVRKGYRLFEYVSISEIIKQSIGQYKKAYLYTERDDGDLTYFIYYHLEVILKCIGSLEQYVHNKILQHDELKKSIRRQEDLNLRQIDLLNHAIRHKDAMYTIKGHLNLNKISWGTARADLLDLADKSFLTRHKRGKEIYFLIPDNIEDLLIKAPRK